MISIVILLLFTLFNYLNSNCAFNSTLSIMAHHKRAIVTKEAICKYNTMTPLESQLGKVVWEATHVAEKNGYWMN